MNKLQFLAFMLSVFVFLPQTTAHCIGKRMFYDLLHQNQALPAADTIFQSDTIYQFVIVYDTIYYSDSSPEIDTLAVSDTLIENTDSAVIVTNRLTLNLKEKKTVYFNQDLKFIENPLREFDEQPESQQNKQNAPFNSPGQGTSRQKILQKQLPEMNEKDETAIDAEPLTFYRRDTIFYFDTIINQETVFDTVFFNNSQNNADTIVTHFTSFEKAGKLVMAIQTVKYTLNRRQSVFVEKNSKSTRQPHPVASANLHPKKKSKIRSSANKRFRKDLQQNSREFPDKNINYTTLLNGGISVFSPSITFLPKGSKDEEYTNCLNKNTETRLSYGSTFTYSYFQNRFGYETGLGIAKHSFLFNHSYQEQDIDTSYFWEYFQHEFYKYDTTWYLNIDTLLQTGDTLFVPSVDSTLLQVTDSIQQPEYDTTLLQKSPQYNYSFSYLEIPVIGKFILIDGKISAQLAIGIIPSFLISKSGKLPLNETGTIVEASEISFDFGFSLSGYGAITLFYRFNRNYSVFVEPYIRQNLYSSLRNDRFLVRNNAWGARFGLSYTLFSTKNKKFR